MTNNIAIITDSISCLTKELIAGYNIGIVPIRLLVQGKVYRDSVDITPSEAYEFFYRTRKGSTLHQHRRGITLKPIIRQAIERRASFVSPFRLS